MTERAAGRGRLSRGALRAWAAVAGAVAFLVPSAALARSPRPPAPRTARPVVVIRRILRTVVIEERGDRAPVRYVLVGSGGAGAPVTSTRGS
jgi:hypothetical protein